mgnify:CR=1 FL=1
MRACFPGSDIPVLGFGTGIFYTDATTVKKSIEHAARTLGYAHFDAAQGYHNEELVGELLPRGFVLAAELRQLIPALPEEQQQVVLALTSALECREPQTSEEERRKQAEEASKSAQAKPAVKTGDLGKELRTASENGDSNKVQELLHAGTSAPPQK